MQYSIFMVNKFALLWDEAQLCLPYVCLPNLPKTGISLVFLQVQAFSKATTSLTTVSWGTWTLPTESSQ